MSSDDDDDNILIVPTQFSPPNSVGGSPAISPKTSVLMARMAAMHSSKSGDFPVEDMPNEDKIDEYHFTVEKLVIGARRKVRAQKRYPK